MGAYDSERLGERERQSACAEDQDHAVPRREGRPAALVFAFKASPPARVAHEVGVAGAVIAAGEVPPTLGSMLVADPVGTADDVEVRVNDLLGVVHGAESASVSTAMQAATFTLHSRRSARTTLGRS